MRQLARIQRRSVLLEQKMSGCAYLAVNTTLLVALEVDANEGTRNNVPQQVKSKLHMAATRASRPAMALTNSLSQHALLREDADTTTSSDLIYACFCLLKIDLSRQKHRVTLQSYIVTPHSTRCLWSVFLLLTVLAMLTVLRLVVDPKKRNIFHFFLSLFQSVLYL